MRRRGFLVAMLPIMVTAGCSSWMPTAPPERPAATVWINQWTGEPTSHEAMIDDLAGIDVIYVGEAHSIGRHHQLQAELIRTLHDRGVEVALALEQLEAKSQPALDRYVRGEISFGELVQTVNWGEQWTNYADYRPVLAAARAAGAPMVALNAPAEVIRAVARQGGIAGLSPEQRATLPESIDLEVPHYHRLLRQQMMAHAHVSTATLRPIIEAQIARDEAMAVRIAGFLASPRAQGRTLVVVTGAGHVNYGLGTVACVRRRQPDRTDRIVILAESGESELDMEAMGGRPVEIGIEDLRFLDAPPGDYLHVVAGRQERAHPEEMPDDSAMRRQ